MMESGLREARERIERFKRLGGVELGTLREDQKLQTEVQVGLAEYNKAVFTFFCPLCGRVERNNQDLEPMCTGPGWTNDHPPELMVLQQ